MTTTSAPAHSVHLQSIGRVSAIPAGEVIAGMKIAYNFGIIYGVESVRHITAKTVELVVVSPKGERFTSRKRTSCLVAAR